MEKKINSLITDFLSDFLCGYRQGFSTQRPLIKLIESWRQSLDSRGYELLIAKLHAYGFNKKSLELILDYLSNKW